MFNVGDNLKLKPIEEIQKLYGYDPIKKSIKINDLDIYEDFLKMFKNSYVEDYSRDLYKVVSKDGTYFYFLEEDMDNLFENMGLVAENNVPECKEKQDNVNHPAHYTNGKVECIDAIESATNDLKGYEAFLTGQVIKYVWRFKRKGNPLEDLQKAEWYLHKLMESVKGE